MRMVASLMVGSLFCVSINGQERDKLQLPVRTLCTIPNIRIVKRVQPQYPPLARQTGVQGKVRLRVTIGKDGAVKTINVVSGHPLLIQSSIDAVVQWQYKPLLINEKPVEMETIVTVIYELAKEKKASDSRSP